MTTFKLHKTSIELNNLHELADALEIMSDDSYDHHVTQTKNDFATWVSESLKNQELSSKLKNARSRQDAYKIVKNQIQTKSNFPTAHFLLGIFIGFIFLRLIRKRKVGGVGQKLVSDEIAIEEMGKDLLEDNQGKNAGDVVLEISRLLRGKQGDYAWYVESLAEERSYGYRENGIFTAASINKIP